MSLLVKLAGVMAAAIAMLSLFQPLMAQEHLEDLSGWESLKKDGLTSIEEQTFETSAPVVRATQSSRVPNNQVQASNRQTRQLHDSESRKNLRGYSFIEKQTTTTTRDAQPKASPILPKQPNDVPKLVSINARPVQQVAQISSNPAPITQIRERNIAQPQNNYPIIDASQGSGEGSSDSQSNQPVQSANVGGRQLAQNNIRVARYSLSDIIRETVNFHPNVARSYASYERARAEAKAARGQWQPRLSLNATQNLKNAFNLPPNESNPVNESETSYGLRLTQNLNYRNLQLTQQAANRTTDARKEELFESQDQIGLEAGLSYVQIFRFYNRFEIGIDYINLLSRIKDKVSARSQSGLTSLLETKKVAVIEARIEAENEFNRRQFEIAQIFLSNISGIDSLNIRALQDFNFRIPSLALTEEKIIEKALINNRSLTAAKKEIEIVEIEWKREKAGKYPALDLDADLTYQTFVDPTRDGTFRDGSIRINFNYDIWDGRIKANEIASSRWKVEESINQYETLKLQLVNQIQEAYAGFNVALSEYNHSVDARKKAIELLRLQEQDFSRGASTSLLDLINTTQDWYQSASEEIDAYYELMSRYLQIKRFSGEILDNNI